MVTIKATGPEPWLVTVRREFVVMEDLFPLALVTSDGRAGLVACRDGSVPIGMASGNWTKGQAVTWPDDFTFKTEIERG